MSAPWRETPNVEWTDERPTEPGEYWLSIAPDKRKGRIDFPSVIPCDVSLCANTYLMDRGSLDIGSDENGLTLAARYITGGAWIPVANDWYDGALWAPRETPADPFAKQETMIRTIKGPCFDCDVRSCWCGWGDNDECACHSPMGERTAPIIKIEPDELRPNVPPRMM